MSEITVFTDGGCSHNGYTNAKAVSAIHFIDYPQYSGCEDLPGSIQTNNRAEMYAVLMAMKSADLIDPSRVRVLKIYTDSLLIINTTTKWMMKWEKDGWVRRGGQVIKNIDLIKMLHAYTNRRPIVWEHVMAHTGLEDFKSKNNHIVDRMCANGLKQKK